MQDQQFPKVPATWEELERLKEYLSDCDVLFLRKKEDQDFYKSYEKKLDRADFIGSVKKQMNGKKIALLENIFPHTNVLQNFPHALHYCLWSTKGALTDEEIERKVEAQFPGQQWMFMTRKEGYVSIPEIWHTHVYIRM